MRSIILDGTEYFYVEDIKQNLKVLKINTDKIFYHKETTLLKGRYIEEKTEFNLMIEKSIFVKQNK